MEPRSNSLSTRNAMAICSHHATTLVPHRTQFLLLAALLIPTLIWAADYTGRVVGVIDGDTIEVLNGPMLNVSASTASAVLKKAKPSAGERSKPPQSEHLWIWHRLLRVNV